MKATTMGLVIAADIRGLSENYFVLGAEDSDRELDVDDIVAKDFDDVMRDARRYHGKDFFSPSSFRRQRPSDVDPDLSFVDFEGGTLLLDGEGTPIGGYVESDLVLDYEWREQGLGTEIVVEHFLSNGGFPTWWLDSAQYSEAGYSTHLSAHAYPSANPDTYLRKMARHAMIDNPDAFAGIVAHQGSEAIEAGLAEVFWSSVGDAAANVLQNWLADRHDGMRP
jgi:hypothetical protein